MLAFLNRRWFLLALIVALAAGIGWPDYMAPIARFLPANVIVAAVTFIMALPLETSALWKAVRRPGPAWLASAINSGVAPPLGWLVSRLLPPELAAGVIVATSVPCTLATAAVWTRRAGGNDAVAFLVTMITNLTCFVVVPAWLWLLVGVRADINYERIITGLITLIVLPIIFAQVFRQWPPIGLRATVHKYTLSRVAQCGVLLMVFVGAVDCGEHISGRSHLSAGNLAVMILAVAAVHVVLLLIGLVSARQLTFDRGDAIAVAFSGSQKTLMVGAYLALTVGPLAILPMVAYHAAQLVIDTLVADRWQKESELGPGDKGAPNEL